MESESIAVFQFVLGYKGAIPHSTKLSYTGKPKVLKLVL